MLRARLLRIGSLSGLAATPQATLSCGPTTGQSVQCFALSDADAGTGGSGGSGGVTSSSGGQAGSAGSAGSSASSGVTSCPTPDEAATHIETDCKILSVD